MRAGRKCFSGIADIRGGDRFFCARGASFFAFFGASAAKPEVLRKRRIAIY